MKDDKFIQVSDCCNSDMIPPDWEMAEKSGSLWRAYACYICNKCGKVCEPVIDIETPPSDNLTK